MSYRGTFRKEKNQNQIWNKKEALPVNGFIIKPLMKWSELFTKNARYVVDD